MDDFYSLADALFGYISCQYTVVNIETMNYKKEMSWETDGAQTSALSLSIKLYFLDQFCFRKNSNLILNLQSEFHLSLL